MIVILFSDFEKDTTNGFCPRYSNWNETTCKGSDGFNITKTQPSY